MWLHPEDLLVLRLALEPFRDFLVVVLIGAELGHPVVDALMRQLREDVSRRTFRRAEQRYCGEHEKSSEEAPHVVARVQRVCPLPAASITCHPEPPELRRRSRSSGGRSKDPLGACLAKSCRPNGRNCLPRHRRSSPALQARRMRKLLGKLRIWSNLTSSRFRMSRSGRLVSKLQPSVH